MRPCILVGLLLIGLFSHCRQDDAVEDAGPPFRDGALDWQADLIWPGLTARDLEFFNALPADPPRRHVHMMHLDGVRPDLFWEMLRHGQLPHFALLLARGKLSLEASTLDKSETMKVIQSYMTSKLDTEVIGWWQFSRDELRFHNYWMDPLGIMNFALGLQFPARPTLFDLLADDGRSIIAGFNLHRRGVPFENYARSYRTALEAVSQHTYYRQADESMSAVLGVFERMVARDMRLPVLSTSLLAPADEFGHYLGVTDEATARQEEGHPTSCFERQAEDSTVEKVFQLLEEDSARGGWILELNRKAGVFRRLRWRGGRLERFCIRLPELEAWSGSTETARMAQPKYALAMIFIDLQLGRLIDMLRSVRLRDAGAAHEFDRHWGNGIVSYIEAQQEEGSLFENTLFFFFGDHGMVDTRRMMSEAEESSPPERHRESQDRSFLESLNQGLGLVTPDVEAELEGPPPPSRRYGVDFQRLPIHLREPHRLRYWQDRRLRAKVAEANRWSHEFFDQLQEILKTELSEKYWWLFFLKRFLLEARLERETEKYRDRFVTLLAGLYLKAVPEYQAAEQEAVEKFFRDHVRLVYGGGARNNAELILPSVASTGKGTRVIDWKSRPSLQEILAYRGPSQAKLIDVLKANPGVGLIFARKNNHEFSATRPVPRETEVLVMDRSSNRGWIRVRPDRKTGRLLFGYRLDENSPGDPLDYLDPVQGREEVWKTFREWNDWCLERKSRYHNVVAGMGAYLHSSNPAIGDLTLTHSEDWNFGGNAAGHGGVHREEKLTVMIASGPGLQRGLLLVRKDYETVEMADGRVGLRPTDGTSHPTLLDLAPTVSDWLGYPESALSDFARGAFETYWRNWVSAQKSQILVHLDDASDLKEALRELGVEGVDRASLKKQLERLLEFMPAAPPPVPDLQSYEIDGNRLILTER